MFAEELRDWLPSEKLFTEPGDTLENDIELLKLPDRLDILPERPGNAPRLDRMLAPLPDTSTETPLLTYLGCTNPCCFASPSNRSVRSEVSSASLLNKSTLKLEPIDDAHSSSFRVGFVSFCISLISRAASAKAVLANDKTALHELNVFGTNSGAQSKVLEVG